MIPNTQAKDMIDKLKINPFIDGPTESLVKSVAQLFLQTREFKYIFSDNIDTYERSDYSERQLPALRVYSRTYRKEHESHYITGELLLDVIYPADLRRDELQRFQDVLTAAMLQQFRRPPFFAQAIELVPGLNELGKVFDVDKTLAIYLSSEAIVPLSQTKANFRIDLKVWDAYLENTGRTKEDPFNVTLAELRTIAAQILPLHDDGTPDHGAEVDLQVTIGG